MCCRDGTHGLLLLGDAFEEVTNPALLLCLGVGQQEQLFGRGNVIVDCEEETRTEASSFEGYTVEILMTLCGPNI